MSDTATVADPKAALADKVSETATTLIACAHALIGVWSKPKSDFEKTGDISRGKMAFAIEQLGKAAHAAPSLTDRDLDALDDAVLVAHKSFGAPGDWGYGYPEGDALKHLYQGLDAMRRARTEFKKLGQL